jgi:alpha-L-rhamnosidase
VSALRDLRTGGRRAPLGLPARPLRLSWAIASDAELDPAAGFGVTISDAGTGDLVWQADAIRPWVVYEGIELRSRGHYGWCVTGAAQGGDVLEASSEFEVGLAAGEHWEASWIAAPSLPYRRESWDPPMYARREFELPEGGVARGRVYATALGIYRLWLNGVELTSEAVYRPGWTDYRQRVYHQTFDCAAALRPGVNVLAATVANGWFAGRLGLLREPGFYGDRTALLVQLEVDGSSGEHTVIGTGAAWSTFHGALIASDLLRGESQDLRQEPEGWQLPGFDASGWSVAEVLDPSPSVSVEPQPHDSIAVHEVHEGTLVHEHARGPAVFDFGQNLVGWTRITSEYLPSVELIVRHGEILTPEQLVYRDNLRGAFQEDRYVVGEPDRGTLEPRFGMHGFRFAEIWGLPSRNPYGNLDLAPETKVEAISVTGLPDKVGSFACSDERLTRLADNVEWTVRDNFLEVMTDCPQREERQGWLGDAGVISRTAAYIFDISAFTAKFVQDAVDAQGPDGEIRNWVPSTPPADRNPGAPGWSDGFVRLVHLLVDRYGDLGTGERVFDAVARFLDHIDRANPDGLRVQKVGADFGDWLSLPDREGLELHTGYTWTGAFSTTPKPIVDTAHSYRSFTQAAEIAARLGRDADATRYEARAQEIRAAYLTAFVADDGEIRDATQTAYAQAIGFGLLTGEAAGRAADRLRAMIEATGHITTGIHGVDHVLPVLCNHGHADLALALLLRDEMPSWLYMVERGATTIWEKWNAIAPDGTLATAEMNSFNHCALGAVGRFLWEGLAGLDASRAVWDGEVTVAAQYTRSLQWVRASHDSPVGLIASHWRWEGDEVIHALEVPGCATARVEAPHGWRIGTDDADARSIVLGPGRHSLLIAERAR